ncbi:MAG: helix-turn-helix domain-containing protein [Lachnospiraceae bacterium]
MNQYNIASGVRSFEFNVRQNFQFPAHFERGAELVYILDGTVTIEIEHDFHTLEKGELAIIFPNQMHSYSTPEYSVVFFMVFYPEMVPPYCNIFASKQPKNPHIICKNVHSDIVYIIKQLVPEAVINRQVATFSYKPDKGSDTPFEDLHFDETLITGYLHVLCYHIFKNMDFVDAVFEDKEQSIQKALTYIHAHYTEPLSREEVAKKIGVSRYYLSRIFTNKVGANFNTYVNTLRILHAKRLLNSGATITEACYQSGFDSQSTFYRVFKELTGTTPKKYLHML